jgi:hypothetical protein
MNILYRSKLGPVVSILRLPSLDTTGPTFSGDEEAQHAEPCRSPAEPAKANCIFFS